MLMTAGADDYVTPNWALEYVDPATGAIVTTTVMSSDDYLGGHGLPNGLSISVSGAVTARSADDPSYIYLIQIATAGDTMVVAQLYPTPGSADDLENVGAVLRLPRDPASRYALPIDGKVRVVETAEPVSPDGWQKLLQGRDPMPEPTTPTNS